MKNDKTAQDYVEILSSVNLDIETAKGILKHYAQMPNWAYCRKMKHNVREKTRAELQLWKSEVRKNALEQEFKAKCQAEVDQP